MWCICDDIDVAVDRQIRLGPRRAAAPLALGGAHRELVVGTSTIAHVLPLDHVSRALRQCAARPAPTSRAADVCAGGQFCVDAADAGSKISRRSPTPGGLRATRPQVEHARRASSRRRRRRAAESTHYVVATVSSIRVEIAAPSAITALLERAGGDGPAAPSASARAADATAPPPRSPRQRPPLFLPPRAAHTGSRRPCPGSWRRPPSGPYNVRPLRAARLRRAGSSERPPPAANLPPTATPSPRWRREVMRALPAGAGPGVRRRMGGDEARPQAVPRFAAPLRRRRCERGPRAPPPRGARRPRTWRG